MSPLGVERVPCAPRWYFTSPLPPSSLETTASIVRSPSNSRRIVSYGRPTTCARTLSRPRCAIPTTTSWAPSVRGKLDRLVEHRDHHVEALDGELLLAEEGAPQVALHPLDLAEAAEQPHPLVARERRGGSGPTRSPAAARPAPRGRRCARSRTRSCRCRSRAAAAAHRRASRRRRGGAGARPGCAPAAPASASESGARARAPGRRAAPSRAGRGARRGDRASGSP